MPVRLLAKKCGESHLLKAPHSRWRSSQYGQFYLQKWSWITPGTLWGTQALKIARLVLHLHRLVTFPPHFPPPSFTQSEPCVSFYTEFSAVSLLILSEAAESYSKQKLLQCSFPTEPKYNRSSEGWGRDLILHTANAQVVDEGRWTPLANHTDS